MKDYFVVYCYRTWFGNFGLGNTFVSTKGEITELEVMREAEKQIAKFSKFRKVAIVNFFEVDGNG